MFSDFFMIWLAKELRPFRALELWVNSIPRALPLGYRLLHRWCVRETKNQELVQTFANFADLAVKKIFLPFLFAGLISGLPSSRRVGLRFEAD